MNCKLFKAKNLNAHSKALEKEDEEEENEMEKVIENCDMESLRDIISFIKIVEIPFDGIAETGEKREETWPPHVTKESIFIIRKRRQKRRLQRSDRHFCSSFAGAAKENIDIGNEQTKK